MSVTVDKHYAGTPAASIEEHYDVSNEFFGMMLDKTTRSYSCALFEKDDETLDEAQVRKIEYHIAKANASGKRRVLDIGCGWGAMVRTLTTKHNVGQAVGLTLSRNQAAHINAMNLPNVEIRLENWYDHTPDEKYDAIISVGAFEHFAKRYLTREERVASYREFFTACKNWLNPGGKLSLQTMAIGNKWRFDREMIQEMNYIHEAYFKETDLGNLSEIIEASERIFDVTSLRVDPQHYSRTCQVWVDNLKANRAEAVALVGEETYEMHLRAMSAGIRSYAERFTTLIRVAFD